MTDDALREIRAIRARLAELELLATQPPKGAAMTIEQALAGRQAPPDKAPRALRSRAHGFVPDPQHEAALVARAKDPAAFDAAYRAMGGDVLALALYADGRAAAIELGTFVPPTSEGDAS